MNFRLRALSAFAERTTGSRKLVFSFRRPHNLRGDLMIFDEELNRLVSSKINLTVESHKRQSDYCAKAFFAVDFVVRRFMRFAE